MNCEWGPSEIKFKAVNRQLDKSIPDVIYFTLEDLLNVVTGAGTVNPWPSKKAMQQMIQFRDYNTNMESMRLFTGCKDSQGKELYGGDQVYVKGKVADYYVIHWASDGWVVGDFIPGHLADMADDLTFFGESM